MFYSVAITVINMELPHYITIPKTEKLVATKKLLIEAICFCPEEQNTY
jgi:hypothetical protein